VVRTFKNLSFIYFEIHLFLIVIKLSNRSPKLNPPALQECYIPLPACLSTPQALDNHHSIPCSMSLTFIKFPHFTFIIFNLHYNYELKIYYYYLHYSENEV
jgi:hypothetical protein